MYDAFHQYVVPALLGLIEGLTEYLPVSSTGHLIVAERSLPYPGENRETFLIFIQLGAILAVLLLYLGQFKRLLDFKSGGGFDGKSGLLKLLLCSLPALVTGVLFGSAIKHYLFSPVTVAIGLIAGALLILYAESRNVEPRVLEFEALTYRHSFLIGCFQCLALWPGMSRSGSTIVGGLLIGCKRTVATEFSFLAAVPIMCAAVGFDLLKSLGHLHTSDLEPFAIGFVVAFISALFAVKALINFVSRYSLRGFAWYRIVFGCVVLAIYI